MVFRRFGYVSSRLLLEMQDEMRQLESDLDIMDKQDVSANPTVLMTHDWPEAMKKRRSALLTQIRDKYCEYCELMNAIQNVKILC